MTPASPPAQLPTVTPLHQVGYLIGGFDVFSGRHLAHIRAASLCCQFLIVGVFTDELVTELTGAQPVVPFLHRMLVVQSLRQVDNVVPHGSTDLSSAWATLRFDVLIDAGELADAWGRASAELSATGVSLVELAPTYS